MLRVLEEGDPIKKLFTAYLEARRSDSEFAESLRLALRNARRHLPDSRRPYDLKRRLSRALNRFRRVQGVAGTGSVAKVVPLRTRRVVRIFPGQTPEIGA
jgi:hypothetical protein